MKTKKTKHTVEIETSKEVDKLFQKAEKLYGGMYDQGGLMRVILAGQKEIEAVRWGDILEAGKILEVQGSMDDYLARQSEFVRAKNGSTAQKIIKLINQRMEEMKVKHLEYEPVLNEWRQAKEKSEALWGKVRAMSKTPDYNDVPEFKPKKTK